jgi:hypothetical protein
VPDNARLKPNLKTLSDAIIRETMVQMRTVVPARVLDYHDGPPSTVKLEISAQQVERDRDGDEGVRLPIILDDVPVWQFGGATSYIRTPLETGDQGVILVCDRSIGSWRADGQAHPPPAPWIANLGECVFLPGFRPDAAVFQPPIPSKMGLVIEAQAIQIGATAEQAAILGNLFGTMWDTLLDLVQSHTHPVPSFGESGTSLALVNPLTGIPSIPAISTAQSTKVFVE